MRRLQSKDFIVDEACVEACPSLSMLKGAEARLVIQQATNAQGFDAWLEADLGDKQIQVEAKPIDIQWFQSNLDEACLSEAMKDFV